MEQKLFDAAARLPQTNATLDTSQIKTKSKVTNGVGRIVITLAACAAAICIILFGALSLAGEIRTYNEAVSYFSMHNLSTDGLSRKEIKDVYKDIITGSFTHPKTAGVLAGMNTTEPTGESEEILYCPAPMTKETYKRLFSTDSDDWDPSTFWSEDNQKGNVRRYYGTYNGLDVMPQKIPAQTIETYTIAGFDFICNACNIMVSKNGGNGVTLEKAYEQGLLTDKDIEAIYNYHKQTEAALYEEFEKYEKTYYCPAPLTKEIYCQMFPSKAEYWNPDNFWAEDNRSYLYRYYGMYNGYGIITQRTNIAVLQDYTTTIAGFTFITHSSHLFACKDGKMIYLDEAYGQGLLTQQDIESIYNYHMQAESICCPPVTDPTNPTDPEEDMLAQYFDLEKTHRPTFDEVLSIQEGTPVSDVVELIGKPHGFAPSHNLVTFWWETVEGYTCLVDLSATLGYLSAPDTVERCFEFCTVDLVIPLIELEVQGSDTSENYDEAGIYNAVSKYFAQREAYLLSVARTIDNVIPGLIKDEDAHKAAIAEAGIEWQSSDIVIHSIAYWDSHAQVVATETVTYRKNGVEKTEAIIHRLQLGQVDDGRIFTARDLYYEAITGFKSCSYIAPPYRTPQPTLTKPTNPTDPPEQTDDPQAGGQDAHVHIYDQQNTAAEYCQAEATCKSAAYYYYSCICGEQGTTTFASGEKKEHSYTVTTVAATCSSEGYKQHTCACGDSYKTDYTPQTYAHDFYQGRAVGHSDDGYDVAYSCYLCHNCDIKVERHGNVEENNHPTTNCYYYITGDLVNDRDYEIVIYGSGEMPHYNSGWLGSPVWFDYLHKTKSIIVAEGITTIGSYAFYCEDAKQTVTFTLPETLEIVHSYGIGVPTKDLYMGSTLRQIKPYAIAYNKVKGSIYLPKTLTLLGNIPLGKKLLYEGSLEDFMNIDTVAWQAVTSMGSQINAMSEANKSMFWLYVNASDRYDDAVYWTEVQMPE